jgi:hypothetical protein
MPLILAIADVTLEGHNAVSENLGKKERIRELHPVARRLNRSGLFESSGRRCDKPHCCQNRADNR